MNIFNRIVMILLSLVLLLFGGMTFLLLTGIILPQNSYLKAILALYTAWRAVAFLNGANTNIAVIISLVIALISLVLLVLEILPIGRLFRRREANQYVVRQDTLGQVTVGQSMIRELVQHEAEAVPGVVKAESEVKNGPDGLHVRTKASLAWGADAPSVGQVLQERIKDAVQAQLGLSVAEVQVTAQTPPAAKQPHPRVA